MLGVLIQKEILLHLLSVRFLSLLLMCALLIPLGFHANYRRYLQRQVAYQEAVKNADSKDPADKPWEYGRPTDPNLEVERLILQPSPLSVFARGLESVLPSSLGMTRNGMRWNAASLSTAPIAFLFGHLDYLFVVSTVFSLLALLFTFDAVAGEREAGTLRITLANALPRAIFLWSKILGGYVVFSVPFLLSILIGWLLLVWQGFPLGQPDVFLRCLCLVGVSLLYTFVFFAMGTWLSIYFESSKTALIVAFTVWVFTVLILPRAGFLAARIVSPAATAEQVYRQKAHLRAELRADLDVEKNKIMSKVIEEERLGTSGPIFISGQLAEKIDERMAPLEESLRLVFRDRAAEIDGRYQREIKRQEAIGMHMSRITPIASFIYLSTGLAQTGQVKRDRYFQTGDRYYKALDAETFSKMSETRVSKQENIPPPLPPPRLVDPPVAEALQAALVDLILLCLFACGLTTAAFVAFFNAEI